MSYKVLIAEDEAHIRNLVKDYLSFEGIQVIEARNGEEAVDKFMAEPGIDLVILDVMMPKMNGFQACEAIREISETPILFLTALSETRDEVQGLELGADDYVTKPFRYEVFMARIKAILRRVKGAGSDVWCAGKCVINEETRSVTDDEKAVELSPKEYELLLYFLKHPDQALERQQILDAVWGYDFYGDPRTIDSHVKNLRAKVSSLSEHIKTLRGFGYKLEGVKNE